MDTIFEKVRQIVDSLIEKLRAAPAVQSAKEALDKDRFQPEFLKEQVKVVSKDVAENPQKYFVIAAIGIAALFILFADYGIVPRIQLEYSRYHLRQELEAEKAHTQQLEEKIKHAQDIDEIERIAREKYNLSKKEETVYIIKP
ncbi:MAG: hypothetical protein HGB19_08885 [Chlorobiales bacterium]|nr:hypothetical protein [Chlorobiales bacterium]